jgi:pyruvate dehydrogenase E2 component (dihydrolipoamide acetyltransferase)
MAALKDVLVPDIGDFSAVPVVEILVSAGDTVATDDPLITLESDKATMDIPAPFGGVVTEVRVALGDEIAEGALILTLQTDGEGAAATSSAEPPAAAAPAAPPAASATAQPAAEAPYASPSVRRLAREQGIDLATVKGTGRKNRITAEDLREPAARPPAAGGPGEVERVPLSRIQRISGPVIARNWQQIPHVTHDESADVTDLEAFRKQVNAENPDVKVTMVALLMKACVASLKEFPDFNASLDGDDLVRKRFYNLGFAADTPQGLVVPVIKAVDEKGLLALAGELRDLSGKARDGKLGPSEMRDGTFTISSLGGIGGTGFTPIINAPEVAILGVSRSAMAPVWDGSAFVPRLMVPLSLSYDHRVIDGAAAARFMVHLAGVVSDLRRVLL